MRRKKDLHASQFVFEWKLNYSDLVQQDYSIPYDSPTFHLSDSEWFFCISHIDNLIKVYLCKNPSPSAVPIALTMGIKRLDSSVLECTKSDYEFQRGCDGKLLHMLHEQDLFESKDIYVPNGTLTIVLSVCLLNDRTAAVGVEATKCIQFVSGINNTGSQQDAKKPSASNENVGKLSEDLKEIFLSRCESDFTIRVKDKEFAVHKIILSARCPVFLAKVDMVEKNTGIVNIDDCDPYSFELFLLFLYSGELDLVSPRNAFSLYSIAKKYQVNRLKIACSKFLTRSIGVDTVCDILLLATLHDEETELLNLATEFFIENVDEIIKTPKWLVFLTKHTSLGNELFMKTTSRRNRTFCKERKIN